MGTRIKELKLYLLIPGIWRRFPHFVPLRESVCWIFWQFAIVIFLPLRNCL
jgi:hypothetical protein